MKRFVSIWFPHLTTDWFALQQPELKHLPFVLKTSSHGRMIVSAANAPAQQKGIYQGMVLADARAICNQVQALDDKPRLAEQLLNRIAEWCIRFTPVAAVDPLGGIILEATGCTHLWGGDKAYLTDIIKRLQAKGYHTKAAMADTIGTAWAAARFRKHSSVVHSNKQLALLMSLPVECLRIDAEAVMYLHKLGLHLVSNIISLPKNALRRRFGPAIQQRLQQALGTAEEFIQPITPVEPYHERLPCLEPIIRIEGIEMALQQLLNSLSTRLMKEGKGLREGVLRCYRIDGKEMQVSISTSAASVNVKHLFHLFQLKLSSIEPGLGIELFVLEATKAQDHSAQQEEIWKANGGLYNRRVAEFIDRISGKMGADVVSRYLPAEHHLPERSFQRVISLDVKPSSEWKIERPRPIILLSPPEGIEVTAPVPDYPPMTFRYKGILHTIVKADGPERMEQEWWIHDGRHRDYYVVEDEEGCRYWLFRSGHYDAERTYRWYVHGFFA